MKKLFKLFAIIMVIAFVLSSLVACDLLDGLFQKGDTPDSSDTPGSSDTPATGGDDQYYAVDVYAINDMHGKFLDNDSQPGVDEMTTYLKKMQQEQNTILLSTGDMWQGGCESGLTKGNIITDWMNELDFSAMALGNHEFDWGTDAIEDNADMADFPFLAINVYDRATNTRVDYCQPSVVVDKGDYQIGIIGAVGDCYSSISADKVEDVYFKVDDDLTALVKAESTRLQNQGVDFIIYALHDGYTSSSSSEKYLASNKFTSDGGIYYDTDLSDGYVDLVFEAHTHQSYILKDEHGVYHLQGGGDNTKGMTHAQILFDTESDTVRVRDAGIIQHYTYSNMAEDPIVEDLLDKYDSVLGTVYDTIGYNSSTRNSSMLRNQVARLYYEAGVEKWGADYDIVLGGGYLSVRSPYDLSRGNVNYAMLYMLLPFDNEVVLCSIKGSDLKNRYFENGSYYIYVGDYGNTLRQNNYSNLDYNKTYYIITDTYNLTYGPNKLTFVASLGAVYARDLMADYIAEGGFN